MSFRPLDAKAPALLLRELKPLRELLHSAEQLNRLQQLLDGQLQPAARPFCRLASWREGILLLIITDSQWATRLRYQERRLLRQLQGLAEFRGLQRILFKVQPTRTGLGCSIAPPQRSASARANLLESAEDTLDFLTSSLTYLIHAESQQAQPDFELIAEWKALGQEVFEVQHALPGSDVGIYQQVIKTYAQRNRDLRPVVDRYMTK